MRSFRRRHTNQFRYGDEFEALGLESVESRRHRFDRSRVNVVGQHNRTGLSLLKNAIANHSRAGSFPVKRIDVPENNAVPKVAVNPALLGCCNGSVWGPHYGGTFASGIFDCVISSLQLAADSWVRHFAEVRMRPTVVPNFVTFPGSSRDNLRMFRDVFADHEKCGLDMMGGQQIE